MPKRPQTADESHYMVLCAMCIGLAAQAPTDAQSLPMAHAVHIGMICTPGGAACPSQVATVCLAALLPNNTRQDERDGCPCSLPHACRCCPPPFPPCNAHACSALGAGTAPHMSTNHNNPAASHTHTSKSWTWSSNTSLHQLIDTYSPIGVWMVRSMDGDLEPLISNKQMLKQLIFNFLNQHLLHV